MHFDDRLATVLRQPFSGEGMARIQFRQLVDILGRAPDGVEDEAGDALDRGFARLADLGRAIAVGDRARLLRQPLQPITNSRLLSWLAEAEPDVAMAAIGCARLDDAAWLALIPRLPVRARGIMRHRPDLSPTVQALLDRLGVQDRRLPPAGSPASEPFFAEPPTSDDDATPRNPIPRIPPQPMEPAAEDFLPETFPTRLQRPSGDIAADLDISDDVLELLDLADDPPAPTSLSEWAKARAAQQHRELREKTAIEAEAGAGEARIGAIVRRIEEFRMTRAARSAHASEDAPRLPLGDGAPSRIAMAIDFSTDGEGRINWADGPYASSVVGINLCTVSVCARSCVDLDASVRRHVPIRATAIAVVGAPAVSGPWQVDALPRFVAGRFAGYCGRLRRPAAQTAPPPAILTGAIEEADRMRQVLHELRTPANAIQVAAEIIQQQLYGPAPHEYRALAATIAGDCAHILAGFEELDRLVKLESGAQHLDEGDCDLARVLAQTVLRLRAWTEPRGSGFTLTADPSAVSLPVSVARAEVERLAWRLFAALAGSTAPGEMLDLAWQRHSATIDLTVALPAVLAERDADALFDPVPGERGQSLATGMFGIGFTLRLATAEAAAAGGALCRVDDALRLTLPALANAGAGVSASVSGAFR